MSDLNKLKEVDYSDIPMGYKAIIIGLIERTEVAERERDEAILTRLEVSEGLSIATRRYEAAEAELARRDAAAGRPLDCIVSDGLGQSIGGVPVSDRINCKWPVGTIFYAAAQPAEVSDNAAVKPFAYAYRYAGCETSDGFQDWREELSRERPADWMIETGKVTDLQELHIAASPQEPVGSVMGNSWVDDDDRGENYWVEWVGGRFPPKGTSLYTMPPAVLPELEQDVKNIIGLLSENEWAEHCTKSEIGRDLEGEITRLHDMRAQPQKVVVLPEPERHREPGIIVGMYESFVVYKALDAAGVKWEVKK